MTLVERKTALDALAEFAEQARSGEGRLVLLEGEAGVGKSALLEHFTLDLPRSRVLLGACDGTFTPRPLGPLFDIAQQVPPGERGHCEPDPASSRGCSRRAVARGDDNRENTIPRKIIYVTSGRPDTRDSSRQSLTRCYHSKEAGAAVFILLHQVGKSTVLYR